MDDHHVEQIAMNDQESSSVGRYMNDTLRHFDAAEMRAIEFSQELVVVAGDVDDAGALARPAQQFLYDIVVGLRPIPSGSEHPAVDDIADEINDVSFVVAKKFEQFFGLAAFGAEVQVGQEQCPDARIPFGLVREHRLWNDIHDRTVGDSCCDSMTLSGFRRDRRPSLALQASSRWCPRRSG